MAKPRSKMRKIVEIPEQKKVVIAKYVRVSTDKQREEGYSVDIQKERLAAYVQSLFPQTEYQAEYREYVDDGFSGGSLDRPRMNQLIEDVVNGEITHVVVVKLDRLSRSQKDTLYLIEDVFLPNNVAFISMGESFNTATPFGRAVVGILSVFAQLERENIYERTRSGMQKRVELGYWPGGGNLPFGYDYDPVQGVLVPNKDAETVRKIYDLYQQGYSKQVIADMFGLKYDRLVDRILVRKANAGVIVYNGKEYMGRHEAIISLDTYEKTMAIMAERSGQRSVSTTDHLLTGLVCCGKCGAKMRYQKWGKAGFKLVCYSQQKSKPYLVKDENCDNCKPWADDIETVVVDAVFRRSKQRINGGGDSTEGKQSTLQILENQRAEMTKKLKRLYSLYAAGDDIIIETIGEVRRDISSLDERIEMEKERALISQCARDAQVRLDSLVDCWGFMSIGEKRTILASVLNKVVVTDKHVHLDFKF